MGWEEEIEPVLVTPEGEELVLLEPDQILYGTLPCTLGMEIEQLDEDVLKCKRILAEYEWHYDGSGPYETGLPPSIAPRTELKKFIDLVRADGCQWPWKNSFEKWHLRRLVIPYVREHGCGSHIHLRPRPALRHKLDPRYERVPGLKKDPPYEHPEWVTLGDVWSVAHNTLVEVYPWVVPLFCYGTPAVFRFRREVLKWARFKSWWITPLEAEEVYLSPDYVRHPYHAVALNRRDFKHILTIELRLNENHPAIAYVTALWLNRIIRRCYERGYIPPQLDMDEETKRRLYGVIGEAVERSAVNRLDLYDELERAVEKWVGEYGPIRFAQPVPRLKREYTSYFELFRDVMRRTMDGRNPAEKRVYALYSNRGNPARNWRQVWELMHAKRGEFCWEEPYVCD